MVYIQNPYLNKNLSLKDVLSEPLTLKKLDGSGTPQVMIYHTHTSETYELLDRGYYTNERSTRSDNKEENMVRIGEEICKTLESNGFKTIHVKTTFDTEYNGAYDRSLLEVSKIIKENPSIQIALDIHRGTIYQKDGTRIKTVAEIAIPWMV